MMQKYFYHEHLADYAEMKENGQMSRGELYGDPEFSHFASKAFLAETLPRLEVPEVARVLELGCGTGPGACFLAELGFQVHGVDMIPDAIDQAREIASERGLDIRYALPQQKGYPTEAIASRRMLPKSGYCLTMGVTQIEEASRWSERSAQ